LRAALGETRAVLITCAAGLLASATPLRAEELTSTSYRMRSASPSGLAARNLVSPGPRFSGSDGDGVDDGTEVNVGSDPNDAGSTPQIPLLPPLGLALLTLALAAAPRMLRRTHGDSS
jgi:hypothetical protein